MRSARRNVIVAAGNCSHLYFLVTSFGKHFITRTVCAVFDGFRLTHGTIDTADGACDEHDQLSLADWRLWRLDNSAQCNECTLDEMIDLIETGLQLVSSLNERHIHVLQPSCR